MKKGGKLFLLCSTFEIALSFKINLISIYIMMLKYVEEVGSYHNTL